MSDLHGASVDTLFSFRVGNLSEIIRRICLLLIAAAVSLGQHDLLCKDKCKRKFRDVKRNGTCVMLFVERPYFTSACLTVLNLAFSNTSALQHFKNNNRIEISSFPLKKLPTELGRCRHSHFSPPYLCDTDICFSNKT